MSKLKIFVSAYACEPGLGSEIGVGWHWVLEMSKYFDLWVLTRRSNQHTIEPWIAEHPEYSHIRFLYFDLPKWARFWKKGMRGVRVYYTIWQWLTNRIVRCTMQENNIEIYHLLTYGNALWPVSCYGKKQCFIWGPTSAGTVIPKDFTRHYRWKSRLKEIVQRFVKKTLFLNIGFRLRCKYADLILCKTDDTIQCIPVKYKTKSKQFTDVAVELKDVSLYKQTTDSCTTVFLAAGTLVGWRNFDVLIEAFFEALKENRSIRLFILGDGDERENLKRMIQERGRRQQGAWFPRGRLHPPVFQPAAGENGTRAIRGRAAHGRRAPAAGRGRLARRIQRDAAAAQVDGSVRQAADAANPRAAEGECKGRGNVGDGLFRGGRPDLSQPSGLHGTGIPIPEIGSHAV